MSDLSNQEKLEEIYQMTIENNKVLRSIRAQQRIANVMRFVYWIVILTSLFGVYLYIKPLIGLFIQNKEKADEMYQQFEQIRQSLPESKAINQFIESIKNNTPKQGGDAGMPDNGVVPSAQP